MRGLLVRILTPIRGEGVAGVTPRSITKRYGLPDIDVCTRRFEGRYIWSGPQGPRDYVLRLERRLRRL